ncbi:hydrogenase expression/formation protein [Allochromatium palmeri]|uniref:Hydrogenase expression/formation protein n=1 Tax=Allochromatium palmeri TaxID=231048 RepID=A0A6N8EBI6_9GAMM|nr:hydrogenase expression/formation protein [Allochromatium palmeri]MTW19956.1 hydrogenase expression/formation protein [Allochromatium palmeri]
MSVFDPARAHPAPGATCARSAREHGHALPILHEIRHALERLLASGEETRIDLQSMPFGPGDLERLTAVLGQGEVQARVEALGPTLIQETAIPGVWLVDYRSLEDQRLSYQIEIATLPEILRPRPEDLAESLAALDARLSESGLDAAAPNASPSSS